MIAEVQNLSKQYGANKAVSNISFSIDRGEIVGFLGVNGAGKSTTLKMLAGCLAPTQGKIVVSGFDMQTHPVEAKVHIGFLPEENPLYEEMYPLEYLNFTADIYALPNKQKKLNELIDLIGLQSALNRKIGQLSKGYRQRLGLAQAIIHQPDLLLLDEPTTGLDPIQTYEIQRLLKASSHDRALLFSSHTLSEVAAICTRILFIKQGEIVADKKMEEVKNLEELFKARKLDKASDIRLFTDGH